MKNHRHLKNSKVLRFAIFVVLGLCLIPLIGSAVTPTGSGALACAGLPMLASFRMEEADDPANPDAIGVGDAIKAIEDKTMPVSQRLGVALKALQGVDPTGQLATIKAELEKAKQGLESKDADFTKIKAELDAAKKQVLALEQDVKDQDAARIEAEKKLAEIEAKEKDLDKRADDKSKEKIRALGFSAKQLPPASDKITASQDLEDLRAEFSKETDALKKGQLAAKIRQLEAKSTA
jgi:hypothetical protein